MARHNRICGDLFKPTIDRAADAYAKIRAKGFDPCSKQTSMKYFEDNDDLYRSVFSIGKFDPSIGKYRLFIFRSTVRYVGSIISYTHQCECLDKMNTHAKYQVAICNR